MLGSLISYYGLLALPAKSYPAVGGWKTALLEPLTPCREMLLRRRNMLLLPPAYTIYTDTLFSLLSITGHLYAEVNRTHSGTAFTLWLELCAA